MMREIDFEKRRAALRLELQRGRVDSFLITGQTNVSYLSGFEGHDSLILIGRDRNFFLTDSRYIEEARSGLKGFDIKLVRNSAYEVITKIASKHHLKRIGFEAMNLPYEVVEKLRGLMGKMRLVPLYGAMEKLRSLKDPTEIELIRRSVGLAKYVLDKIMRSVRPGVTEKSLSKNIEIEFMKNGARAAFDPIVASGSNSSKPHAQPRDAMIKNNSVLMIDMGCCLDYYNSDITRTLFLGNIENKFKKIYGVVKTAQLKAIEKIRSGIPASTVDRAARRYIESKGFGKCFSHSVGHGIGMEVHERPAISRTNTTRLAAGMVFTVEPAVYIPGVGGIRIEDMVMVTETGCVVLTA